MTLMGVASLVYVLAGGVLVFAVAQVEYRQEQKRLRDMAASHAASFLNGVPR
jgi:hypothetical protein